MTQPKQKFRELLTDFKNAMLVTRSDDGGIRARPMHVADVEKDGDLWFVTSRNSGMADEISGDTEAAVTFQGDHKFISVSGLATLVEDRERVRQLWTESMRPWFPDGPNDMDVVAIQFVASEAEYWDSSGFKGVRYLFEALRAMLKGEQASIHDPEYHSNVSL